MIDINGPYSAQGPYSTGPNNPNLPELTKATRTALARFRDTISDLIANPNLAENKQHLQELQAAVLKVNDCIKAGQFLQGSNAPKTEAAENLSSALQIAKNILEAPVAGDSNG